MRLCQRGRNACQQVGAGNDVGQPQMVLRAHGNASLLAEAAQGEVDRSQAAKATRRMRVIIASKTRNKFRSMRFGIGGLLIKISIL